MYHIMYLFILSFYLMTSPLTGCATCCSSVQINTYIHTYKVLKHDAFVLEPRNQMVSAQKAGIRVFTVLHFEHEQQAA